MSKFLITGGCGFLGAWILRRLLDDGHEATVLDLKLNPARWSMLLTAGEIARVGFVAAPIEDTGTVREVFLAQRPDAVIHLAGLQVPACRADPLAGAKVNVFGTLNVFEAVKALNAQGVKPSLVYASSAAVFGADSDYDTATVNDTSVPLPASHYGAYKLCNEHSARAYWHTAGINSVGLRPLTVYGPGRDTGMTSFPNRSIAAAIKGIDFEIPFSGPTAYIHAREVADIFIACATKARAGASVYTVGGDVATTAQFVAELEKILPGSSAKIKITGGNLPIASRLDDAALRRDYPGLLRLPLHDGIRETVAVFQKLHAAGNLGEG